MKHFLSAMFCLAALNLHGQNLVPNPSFELHSTCPVGFSQYTGYISTWINPSAASPDYYHSCANPNPAGTPVNGFGYQSPRTGNAYSGFYATAGTYREFIQVQLTSALVAGVSYTFSMYVNCHNRSKWVTDDLGAYISVTAPSSAGTGFLGGSPVPQIKNPSGHMLMDTLNWELISGTYIATGGERFLTIGHFSDDAQCLYLQVNYGTQGGYYYIDDVSLVPSTPLPVQLISFSAEGQEGKIGLQWSTATEINNDYFDVQRSENGQDFISIASIKGNGNSCSLRQYQYDDNHVKEDIVYYYRLRQVDFDGRENFSGIAAAEMQKTGYELMLYSNAGNQSTHIHSTANSVRVYDSTGREKFFASLISGDLLLNTEGWTAGVYFLEADWNEMQKMKKFFIE
jgi:hypothetical protein